MLQDIDNARVITERNEIAARIDAIMAEDGILDLFPDITVMRASRTLPPFHSVVKPAFCVIARGSKRVELGDETFCYDEGHYLLSTVDLPVTSCIIETSEENPYLSFRLDLEPSLVAQVLIDSGLDLSRFEPSAKAMNVNPVNADLLNAIVRILRLVEKPDEIENFLPMIKREIIFRLLKSDEGPRLAHLISASENRRISRAVQILRENFDRPLSMDRLARDLGMSVSSFHQQFKSVTAMSPLQFQKQVRLQEARRLMLGEDLDAASAGFRVGYEDPSYFSRDYKKAFGAPPQRDIARLRVELAA
ncbi:MAG: AraC family transcriptional regulator [Pyrinomonadaceae bacterium]|nr:AraC family transcriptional regulator [Pyrinomonadaceae bacterium]